MRGFCVYILFFASLVYSNPSLAQCTRPTITVEPQAAAPTCSNGSVIKTITVTATGTTLSYQWFDASTNVQLTNSAPYSGVNTRILTITNPPASLAGKLYRVVVSNACGADASESVSIGSITGNVPVITQQPPAISFITGTSLTITTTVTNASSYAWYDSDVPGTQLPSTFPFSGATTNALTILSSPSSGKEYYVKVTNACGSILSSSSVLVAPANLSVSASGCGFKTIANSTPAQGHFNWYWQGTNASGQDFTSAQATASSYQAFQSGTYYIRPRTTGGLWGDAKGITVTLDALPTPPDGGAFSFCEWESVTMTLNGASASLRWYENGTLVYDGLSYSPINPSAGQHTYSVKNVDVKGCESSSSAQVTLTIGDPSCDSYVNWSESTDYGYAGDGTMIPLSSSRSYVDGFGKLLQSQQKIFTWNEVMAVQSISDAEETPAITTLPAPLQRQEFLYSHKFATNVSGDKYSASDFDGVTSQGTAGEVNNPKPLASSTPGTLGWYYSASNTSESQTPTTSFPYSRVWQEAGPDPKLSKSAGPGDLFRMGSGHEQVSERSVCSSSELEHYFKIKGYFAPDDRIISATSNDCGSVTGFAKTGDVTLTNEVQSGNGYLKVVSNQTGGTPGVSPINGEIAVQPFEVYKFRVKGYTAGSIPAYLYVRYGLAGVDIEWQRVALFSGAANDDWVESIFTIPASCHSISIGVKWAFGVPGQTMYLDEVRLYKTTMDPLGYKTVITNEDGTKTVAFTDGSGKTLATALLTGAKSNGLPTYDQWSYSYYNETSQLIASVAPNGVNPASDVYPSFVTLYSYDHLGRTIETTDPDQGKTQFVYSTDGKIRFSQNQVQREATPQRFSYTNYDRTGRLIESGEYLSTGADAYKFEPHTTLSPSAGSVLNIIDDIGFTGLSYTVAAQKDRCSDYVLLTYDFAATDLPAGDQQHATQEFLIGQISKSENANSKTWYSYDEFGQLLWSKQSIETLGVKTIDYTYDYQGNVTQVFYSGAASDAFYHHYEYDADQRLSSVYTSKDGVTKTLRAKYYYYLHGPLKRVELGGSLQGIDYIYNIDGSLKLINHPDPTLDPGQDGITGDHSAFAKDIFGEALDYHVNDYTGAGYTAGNVTLGGGYPDRFNGSVKAVRWHSAVDSHVPRTYAFTYDNVDQLKSADWGDMTGSAGAYGVNIRSDKAYQEAIDSYDKNGNIQGLQRKGKTGNSLASYAYSYESNTNKLDRITEGGSTALAYEYNAIGQMTQQTEGTKVMNVTYTVHGKVKEIRNGANQLMLSYLYDDHGDRIRKSMYGENGVVSQHTYYVYDGAGTVLSIYEQDATNGGSIQQTEVPIYGAGRVAIFKPLVNTTFYEVSDHLGNVRGVIGNPETLVYTATLEDNGQAVVSNPRVQEMVAFKNLSTTAVEDVNMNHTAPSSAMPVPVYSAYLKWIDGINGGDAAARSIGPAVGLKVEPGDKMDIEAWVKYERKTSYGRSGIAGTMASILGTSYVGTAAGLDVLAHATEVFQNGLTSALSATAVGNGNDTNVLPYAYVYYLLYDRSFNFITAGWKRVTSDGGFDPGYEAMSSHGKLTIPTLTFTEPGYVYVFVSNESENTKVWFDDLKVTHQRSTFVAGADYYPFGSVMENREADREDYRYGYQGQFSEKDETTQWNEFELRFYDAKIGRWLSADPYGQYSSPFIGMGNSPNVLVDPTGGWSLWKWIANPTSLDNLAGYWTRTLLGNLLKYTPRAVTGSILFASHSLQQQKSSMTQSANGQSFTHSWEDFRSKMYNDRPKNGNATIGWGHKIHDGPIDDRASEAPYKNGITRKEGDELYEGDKAAVERQINTRINRYGLQDQLSQAQFDALVDLEFNAGGGPVNKVLKKVKANATDIHSFIENANITDRGHVVRRQATAMLFTTGQYFPKYAWLREIVVTP